MCLTTLHSLFNINGKLRYVKQDLLLFLSECISIRHRHISKGEEFGPFLISSQKFRCLFKAYLNYLTPLSLQILAEQDCMWDCQHLCCNSDSNIEKETLAGMLCYFSPVIVDLKVRKIKVLIQFGIWGSVHFSSAKMIINLVHIDKWVVALRYWSEKYPVFDKVNCAHTHRGTES